MFWTSFEFDAGDTVLDHGQDGQVMVAIRWPAFLTLWKSMPTNWKNITPRKKIMKIKLMGSSLRYLASFVGTAVSLVFGSGMKYSKKGAGVVVVVVMFQVGSRVKEVF